MKKHNAFLNKYKVYFKDGSSKEYRADCKETVKCRVSLIRPITDILRIEYKL